MEMQTTIQQRFVKVSFKTDKETGVKKDTVEVGIAAAISFNEIPIARQQELLTIYMRETQDKIVREAVEAGRNEVSEAEVSFNACYEFMVATEKGNRLTKQYLENWFSESLEEILTVAIADKLALGEVPTARETQKVAETVTAYKNKLTALASGRTRYPEAVCKQLQKALGYITEDITASKLYQRLQEMIEKPVEADLLAL